MSLNRTIWVVDREGAHYGVRTPIGPHLLLRGEPCVGERIVARLEATPIAWTSDAGDAAVIAWSVRTAEHTPIRLLDSCTDGEPDITVELLREILLDDVGEGEEVWAAASVRVVERPEAPIYVDIKSESR